MSGTAPETYSTNPNTIKARRRKMALTEAEKVEDAAKTADYKAMCYTRSIVQAKPGYLAASDVDKAAMLEQAMRKAMEKRRAKRQDTYSKLAAFHAPGSRVLRSGTRGPQTHAPISKFLFDNGYVPARAGSKSQGAGLDTPRNDDNNDDRKQIDSSIPAAPYPDMGVPSTPSMKGVHGLHGGFAPSSSSLFMSTQSPNGPHDIKAANIPAPFANMTPEPMESIEVDPQVAIDDLRNEFSSLRNVVENTLSSRNSLRDCERQNMPTGLGTDSIDHVAKLDGRLSHLEGVVQAIRNVLVPAAVDRVAALEEAMEELKAKVGEGCDAEVAKMREIFGGMKELFGRVGGFM